MSKSFFLVTAFGKDRPGMVAGMSAVLYQVGGNIEDASMTRLGGEFSMMLMVSVPTKTPLPVLTKKLQTLEKRLGLQVNVKAVPATLAHVKKRESPKYLISVYGTDHPGIVSTLTEVLAKRKVSITDLQTKVTGGAKPLYVMLLEVAIPESADLDALRSELDDLRQTLNVEITLQDIEAVAL